MSGGAQAPASVFFLGLASSRGRLALLFCALSTVSGCGAGGFSLKEADVDRSLYTSDIPPDAKRTLDKGRSSDEQTIRNAVSSVDLTSLDGKSIAWANTETGTRGVITDVTEFKEDRLLCRGFITTRESFDGVGLFKGEVCTASAGVWHMQSFVAS